MNKNAHPAVTFSEALAFWLKLGFISFGGPAGQIAIMHRVLVDEKKWIEESRFLHALNFCVLLPGPEAQKLATYAGWLLHGVRGGLAAGAGTLAAPGDRQCDRARPVVGASGRGADAAWAGPCARRHWAFLLQARGGELRWRLCAARVHGAAGGRDLPLDERAGDGRRPWPRGDHAGTADPRHAVRRLPRRLSRRRAVFARRGGHHRLP